MKLEIDKDGLTLISEDRIDFAYLDYWTQGKEVHLPSFGIRNSSFDDRKSIATLRIEFRKPELTVKDQDELPRPPTPYITGG